MPNYGVFVTEQATGIATPNAAQASVPFVLGLAPVQSAAHPAGTDPVLCTSWAEAVDKLGYSDDWATYSLCEFMYSHFKLFACQPVVFCNCLDVATMKANETAADLDVTNHQIKLPLAALDDTSLVIKTAGGTGNAYVKDTDYAVFYSGENLVIELIATGGCYSATSLNVAYAKVTTASVTASVIATAVEKIEQCLTVLGIVPDLICAPGFSDTTTAAAAMAAKAGSINGLFRAKALIDISASSATSYSAAVTAKSTNGFTDENEIVCWPMRKVGTKKFHLSTLRAGLMAQVDAENGGIPYEAASNKPLPGDAIILADGTEVKLTLADANTLRAAGICTELNFLGACNAWGDYTGCYPGKTDVKDIYVSVSRMFDYVANTLVRTCWQYIDRPMTRRLLDTVLDSTNLWLNGLVGSGYLLGARVTALEGENPITSLIAGKIKFHIYLTPPVPAQEIDFVLEYDAEYLTAALSA